MPNLREDMVPLFAELQQIPVDLGFRERVVELVNYTVTGENKARQKAGTRTPVKTPIAPAPKVTDAQNLGSPQYVKMKVGVIEEGDLFVSAIPRTYPEEQLREAEDWCVDGEGYRLIRLNQKALSWEALLRKAKS